MQRYASVVQRRVGHRFWGRKRENTGRNRRQLKLSLTLRISPLGAPFFASRAKGGAVGFLSPLLTDTNTHQTSFAYDAYGRVTQTTFPSNLIETYVYDSAGNLINKTDRKNQTIQYVYDTLNRMTQKTYPDSTSVEYVYDLVDKIQQVSDPTGTYAFAYDPSTPLRAGTSAPLSAGNMGRLVGSTTQYALLTGPLSNAYTYDAASNSGFRSPVDSTASPDTGPHGLHRAGRQHKHVQRSLS